MIEKYKNLPDYMSIDDLEKEFSNFLTIIKSRECDLIESLESLTELSDRQWHTYKFINEKIKFEIENWILNILNFESLEIIELIFFPTGTLGLSRVFETLKESLKMNLESDIRKEIEEFIKECDGNVDDPYYSLK